MNSEVGLGVAIVGCGAVGHKRAKSLGSCRLIACADPVLERARSIARANNSAEATTRWQDIVARSDVDLLIISTPNGSLAAVALAAVQAGKHVLVEKPGARRAGELDPLIDLADKVGVRVRVGFNHRYHPAMRKARAIIDSGALGELMFIRGRYGHGGRPGYEREWRANPDISGGGELIDQGVHLIDLARWFLGEFPSVQGFAHTYFWDMPVDDNAFLLLRTKDDQAAFLHVSCTEWKNTFSFEIYGRDGKLDLTGLDGSYGIERIAFYRMLPGMGPPETTIWEYPQPDTSWETELAEFVEDIRLGRTPNPSLRDAQAALRIVERVYEVSGR